MHKMKIKEKEFSSVVPFKCSFFVVFVVGKTTFLDNYMRQSLFGVRLRFLFYGTYISIYSSIPPNKSAKRMCQFVFVCAFVCRLAGFVYMCVTDTNAQIFVKECFGDGFRKLTLLHFHLFHLFLTPAYLEKQCIIT